ncbi:MAG: 50S ribosomal protein L29 [Candidatus Omnitrophica bacterium]|jgi:large subunit ribosomal protein L29|nr:50S ribosomal protein L29 [Candidatus Omnitrophota bacterium]
MKIKELRALSNEELKQKAREISQQLFKANQGRYTSRVDKPHVFSMYKKDIARINTLLNEKKEKKNGK